MKGKGKFIASISGTGPKAKFQSFLTSDSTTMENLQKTQHESFEDYSKQASNASKIANQLEQTRIEAERVAREEVR